MQAALRGKLSPLCMSKVVTGSQLDIMEPKVIIIGGGLAGSEAAWQLAEEGIPVRLYEMRPGRSTPAHQTGSLAELVCSNSFRSAQIHNAVGLLKAEMALLDSLIMSCAFAHRVPGGSALAIDRGGFAQAVTQSLVQHPRVEIIREEVRSLSMLRDRWKVPLLIASGPLTSDALSREICSLTQSDHLYFYDSIAPIVEAESINLEVTFRASRYGKGSADYINCPFLKEDYEKFIEALLDSEKVPIKEFDQPKFFEGCLPVEVMAERGPRALSFGPMKPVGLTDPRTGKRPYAVVQLRQDDLHGNLYNLVGFQTRMKYPEQKRIFRMIPGLENAEFVRLGSMHRNTFINSPQLLTPQLELRDHPGIYFAGQMIGVEGYVESSAMGLYAGLALAQALRGQKILPPTPQTALGALIRHVTEANPKRFQPMNVNFGIFDIPQELRRKDRRDCLAQRSLEDIKAWNPKSKDSWITSKMKGNTPPIPLKTTVTT